ncbi:MAG: GDP-mannose 4,6-dehydratase [Proteobacteria bacterium]|nr:GDP-mannose 4,6-dehydratase [Pseudomonadota bacterium]
MDKIFVVGAGGQDGRIICNLLGKESIIGFHKDFVVNFGEDKKISVKTYEKELIKSLVKEYKPKFLYYLASYHHSSEEAPEDDISLTEKSNFTHFILYNYFLEAIRLYSPETRVFYSASSLIFGNPPTDIQDEKTPINPVCIYGITKASGFFLGRYYRDNYHLFVSNGILYNHESEFRSDRFLFPKIIKSAIDIKKGKLDKIIVGNLSSVTDWGYAYDYVDAMIKILHIDKPDDFVIATGEGHTVRDLVEVVFTVLGLDYKNYVCEDKNILKRNKPILIGNPKKLSEKTGWKRSLGFKEMIIKIMSDMKNE